MSGTETDGSRLINTDHGTTEAGRHESERRHHETRTRRNSETESRFKAVPEAAEPSGQDAVQYFGRAVAAEQLDSFLGDPVWKWQPSHFEGSR
jgi:hypothetical protein